MKNLSLYQSWVVTAAKVFNITQISVNFLIAEVKIHELFHVLNTLQGNEDIILPEWDMIPAVMEFIVS